MTLQVRMGCIRVRRAHYWGEQNLTPNAKILVFTLEDLTKVRGALRGALLSAAVFASLAICVWVGRRKVPLPGMHIGLGETVSPQWRGQVQQAGNCLFEDIKVGRE